MTATKKEITFKTITEILSYNFEKSPQFSKDIYSQLDDERYTYDYEAHIRHIQKAASDNNLESFIKISNQNTEKEFIQEAMHEYFTKYTITIENLTIRIDSEKCDNLILDRLSTKESYPAQSTRTTNEYNGGIQIKFLNNEFIADDSKRNPYVKIALGENAYAAFNNNTIKGADIYFGLSPHNSFLILQDNTFDNRHVTIRKWERKPTTGYTSSNWHLPVDHIERYEASNRLEEMIDEKYYDPYHKLHKELRAKLKARSGTNLSDILNFLLTYTTKITVSPQDVVKKTNNSKIISRITDNEFTQLNLLNGVHYYFRGSNIINQLVADTPSEHFHWGQYQQLDTKGKFAHAHKQFFMKLKANTIEKHDGFQELILKREIAKCESHLIKEEKSFRKAFQDRVVLWIGKEFSDYGASWTQPLLILFLTNFNITLYFFNYYCLYKGYEFNFGYIFAELFNPVSNLADTMGTKYAKASWLMSTVNTFQKLIFAGTAYEIIKVFRRFSGK